MRDEIINLLRNRPYMPFRVVMNNGDRYDVLHPEFLLVGRHSMHYYVHDRPPPEYKDYRILSLLLVNHVEPIDQPQPAAEMQPMSTR